MKEWQIVLTVLGLVVLYFVYEGYSRGKFKNSKSSGSNNKKIDTYRVSAQCHNCKEVNDVDVRKGISREMWLTNGAKCDRCGLFIRKPAEKKGKQIEETLF